MNNNFVKGGIVVHAASVGEVIALKPYIEQLLRAAPELVITFTTFTPTGSAQVRKIFADHVQHSYLPLDIWPCTWLFLRALQPRVVVLMETELWPNLIAQCHQQGIALQLINARLSNHSMKSYHKLGWLIQPCLQRFDQILSQSIDNQQNFITLGAPAAICQVSGNLKYDLQTNADIAQKANELAQFVDHTRKTWLVASTHPGDEELILASFALLKQHHPQLLLILVPRHPERFASVNQLCVSQGFNTIKRSEKQAVDISHDIWLIDSLGELLALCDLADIVTMGGSFSTIGGHNPLEPALFKKPIVVGHDMSNFKEVMGQLIEANGIIQLPSEQTSSKEQIAQLLYQAINDLLQSSGQRQTIGQHAYQVVHANQGASAFSVKALLQLLVAKKINGSKL